MASNVFLAVGDDGHTLAGVIDGTGRAWVRFADGRRWEDRSTRRLVRRLAQAGARDAWGVVPGDAVQDAHT